MFCSTGTDTNRSHPLPPSLVSDNDQRQELIEQAKSRTEESSSALPPDSLLVESQTDANDGVGNDQQQQQEVATGNDSLNTTIDRTEEVIAHPLDAAQQENLMEPPTQSTDLSPTSTQEEHHQEPISLSSVGVPPVAVDGGRTPNMESAEANSDGDVDGDILSQESHQATAAGVVENSVNTGGAISSDVANTAATTMTNSSISTMTMPTNAFNMPYYAVPNAIGYPPNYMSTISLRNQPLIAATSISTEPNSNTNDPPHSQTQDKFVFERPSDPSRYTDVSHIQDPKPVVRSNKGGVTDPFPEKLHRMLTYAEENHRIDIISFLPHGRAFAVHKAKRFVDEIMPLFFRQTRLTSFQRQLNLYGFKRLSHGPDTGAYYHELFLKGRPGMCVNLKRTKIKGSVKSKSDPQLEPNFYAMPPLQILPASHAASATCPATFMPTPSTTNVSQATPNNDTINKGQVVNSTTATGENDKGSSSSSLDIAKHPPQELGDSKNASSTNTTTNTTNPSQMPQSSTPIVPAQQQGYSPYMNYPNFCPPYTAAQGTSSTPGGSKSNINSNSTDMNVPIMSPYPHPTTYTPWMMPLPQIAYQTPTVVPPMLGAPGRNTITSIQGYNNNTMEAMTATTMEGSPFSGNNNGTDDVESKPPPPMSSTLLNGFHPRDAKVGDEETETTDSNGLMVGGGKDENVGDKGNLHQQEVSANNEVQL